MPRIGTRARWRVHAGWVAAAVGLACVVAGTRLYLRSVRPNRELLQAAMAGDNRAVRALLRDGADPDWHDEKRQCAVAEAALRGDTDTVFLLLDHGADVGDALWGAVWRPRPTLVRKIFARHPDAAEHWRFHRPLLEVARDNGQETVRAVTWGLARARRPHPQAPAGPARAQP